MAKDAKVLDNENAVIIRKTPSQLRMDEVFCPPFAATLRSMDIQTSSTYIVLESITLGCKIDAWQNFITALFPVDKKESSPQVKPSKMEENPPPQENTKSMLHISVENLSLYYQPSSTNIGGTNVFVVPPRALFTLSVLKV